MKNFLKTITIIILGLPYALRNVIINLVFNPIDKLKRKITSRRYSEFVSLYNDRNFFVYKNKPGAEQYIENEVRPFLPKNIIFVNLNENNEVAKYAQIVDILKREMNFPVIVKIQQHNLFKKNMYDDFYKCMFIEKSPKEIVDTIITFFEE